MAELVHCDGEPTLVSIAAEVSKEELQAQQDRLARELARLQKEEAQLDAKLANSQFLARAPQPVVEKTRARQVALVQRREAIEAQQKDIAAALQE